MPMIKPLASRPGSRLSRSTLAAIALLESGMTDMASVANAVGTSVERVARLLAEGPQRLRAMAKQVPDEFAFRLRRTVNCPRCGSRIYIAPCLQCRVRESD